MNLSGKSIRRLLAIAGVLVGSVVFALLVYLVALAFSGYVQTTRGSLAYHVFMDSDVIRGVPIVEPVGEETFIYDWGDGPAPCSVGVLYRSKAPIEELLDRIDAYLTEMGYSPDIQNSGISTRAYSREKDLITVDFGTSDGWAKVVVTEYTY